MPSQRDPEVDALLASVRSLTAQAHRLSGSINATLEELNDFVIITRDGVVTRDRRRRQLPIIGEDRRRG